MKHLLAGALGALAFLAAPALAQSTASKGYVDLGAQVQAPKTDCGPAGIVCMDNAASLGQVEVWLGYNLGFTVQNWADISYLFRDDAVDWTSASDAVALIKQVHASSPIQSVMVESCWHRMKYRATYDYATFVAHATDIVKVSPLKGCFVFNN